ncbi:MAG: hypothetical protein IH983_08555 [Planctomycetes bacterium]|nr:hypothetical protein [Planctomycetota bacterium]
MSDNDLNNSDQMGYTGDTGGDPGESVPGELGSFNADPGVDVLAKEGSAKKRRTGALVLILVVGLALGGLFAMHTLAKVSAAGGGNTDTEETIEKFLRTVSGDASSNPGTSSGDLVNKHRSVLDVLHDDYTSQQVALSDVQRNPFVLVQPGVTPDTPGNTTSLERKRAEIENAAGQLRLKSIIMGSNPLANVNGRFVRLDEMIAVQNEGIAFRVAEITSDTITLVAEDADLELTVVTVLYLKQDR